MKPRQLRQKEFTVPDGIDLDFKTVTVREITTRDELDAAAWAMEAAPEQAQFNPMALRSYEFRELVRASLVAVDGAPVAQPYTDMDGWRVRSFKFLQTAYDELNGIDADALKKFKGTASSPRNPVPAGDAVPSASYESDDEN